MGWWKDVLRTRAQDWIYAPLDTNGPTGAGGTSEIASDSAYLSIFLRSARVVDVRKGLKRFYGVVHSAMKLPHRSGGDAIFSVVTAPSTLRDIDAGRLDRVVQLNHRLLGPVPYVGGDLEMEVGLFSIATADLVAPYLDLLEKLSTTAGVAYLSAASALAGPIIDGINLLVGAADDTILEIGISDVQSPPRAGHFAVIRAPKGTLNVADLRLDPNDFRILDAAGQPLADFPYIVFEIEPHAQRDDWFKIPELSAAYEDVRREYREGRRQETEDALAGFRRVAKTCNDLLWQDADRLAQVVESQYLDAGPPRPSTRGLAVPTGLPELGTLDLYAEAAD